MTLLNRRRNYFIDKRLQGIWALLNLMIAGVIGLLIGLEVIRSFYVQLGWPLASRPFTIPDLLFIIKLIILALIGGGFFWLLSAFAAHRIAGPVFRLNQSLKELAGGNYSLRIKFRKKDFFHDVATNFNDMADHVERKLQEKEDLLNKTREKVRSLPRENKEVQELRTLLNIK